MIVLKQLCADCPEIPSYRQSLSGVIHNMAEANGNMGEATKAAELHRQSLEVLEALAAQFPRSSWFNENLGMAYLNAGHRERKKNVRTALEWYRKATVILDSCYQANPKNVKIKQYLATGLKGAAECFALMGRYAEALVACDRALALDDGTYRPLLSILRWAAHRNLKQAILPSLRLARAGEHAKAVAEVEALVVGFNGHPDTDYNAACVYSICAGFVMRKNPALAESYAKRAVGLLTSAKEGGVFNDPAMLKLFHMDKDLESLRDRADYKKLAATLGKPPAR